MLPAQNVGLDVVYSDPNSGHLDVASHDVQIDADRDHHEVRRPPS
jgi:hypothetical protein